MEYSPHNAIPYVSWVDAGTKEMVEQVTGAEDRLQRRPGPAGSGGARRRPDRQPSSCGCHLPGRQRGGFCIPAGPAGCRESTTEYAVQQVITRHLDEHKMEYDHGAIVSVNGNAADPHYSPTADRHAPIGPGDMVLIDLWGRETRSPLDCFADITWTAYCGAEVPAFARQISSVVASGRDAAVHAIQQQMAANQPVYGYAVDDACRAVIDAAGDGAAFFHRTGHSLGVRGHFDGVNIDDLEDPGSAPSSPTSPFHDRAGRLSARRRF
jgi:hypothetical protein